MMGVPLVKAKLSAYAVGAFFGGLGGVGFASAVTGNVASSRFDFSVSITVLLMVVLGGMGNVWGVAIGAVVLSWVNSTGLSQFGMQFDEWTGLHVADKFQQNQFLLFGVVLVLMMLFRPGGLIPEKRTAKLMLEPSRTEAESLGADISEAEAEDEIVSHSTTGQAPMTEAPTATPPPAVSLEDNVRGNVLYADHVTIRFGGLVAVNDVSFSIPPKSIVSLIGPNGAGKTTFFNVITGLYAPTEGAIYFEGADITGTKPHIRAAAGIARTFQNIRLFNLMTAEENVMVAMHSKLKSGMVSTILRMPWQRREERAARDLAHDLLRFVGIGKVAGETARNLSYGDQRRLEVARALALAPKVLLLDEPTAGMNPQESAAFNDFVHRVRDEKDVAILLIEHDMSVVMRVSERITVLDRGETIAEGGPDDIRNNPRVVEAYLGKSGTEQSKEKEA